MEERLPCLLIHGFTGGPYEVDPLAHYLSERGVMTRSFSLPGHDPELAGLGSVTCEDWMTAASREAEMLLAHSGAIDIVGFSMGGLLATYLANRYPVRRLVLLSTPVYYLSPLRFIREVVERLGKQKWDDFHKANKTPARALRQFMRVARLMRPEFVRLSIPVCVVHGTMDPIVHPGSAKYIYKRIQGEKELHMFRGWKHMVCLEEEASRLFAIVERFLKQPNDSARHRAAQPHSAAAAD